MHTRSTAGQATIEYLAAIALIAAIFLLAGPAVGAPPIGEQVVHGIRLGICLVADDVCSREQAAAERLPPCPLRSDTTGHELSATAFSIEVGHRWTLNVTQNSDGTVSVVRTASGTAGLATGEGVGGSAGPLKLEVGISAGARDRVQVASGWEFKDQAAAHRFLEHATLNSFNESDFPATWHSLEGGNELAASVGVAAGREKEDGRMDLLGLGASGTKALGGKLARDGTVTLYGRITAAWDASWPGFPTTGSGTKQVMLEYTFNRDGPRELAFRNAYPSDLNNKVTETVARLDLRDAGNRAVAQTLIDTPLPWPPSVLGHVHDVLARIDTHGTVETTVSEVNDSSRGVSAHVSDEIAFGVAGTLINVHKQLVSAYARTNGSLDRDRFDCLGDHS